MITTNEGLLEAWATQLETMEQNLESFFGAPSITPTLPAVTTREGMLEAIATGVESVETNMKNNCPAVAKGTSVTIETKSVPNALKSIVLNGAAQGMDGTMVFDGDTDVYAINVRTNTVRCYVNVPDYAKTGDRKYTVTGSYLPKANTYDTDVSGITLAAGSNYRAYIGFPIDWIETKTAAGIKAFLADNPLTIWYVTNTYDSAANQYYTMSVTESDGTFHGIATTNAIAPLDVGDNMDFVKGIVSRGGTESSVSVTESFDNLYGALTISCPKSVTVKYVKEIP